MTYIITGIVVGLVVFWATFAYQHRKQIKHTEALKHELEQIEAREEASITEAIIAMSEGEWVLYESVSSNGEKWFGGVMVGRKAYVRVDSTEVPHGDSRRDH